MSHPVGERLRCDSCGAEIVFTSACPCPEKIPKQHSDICCGKEMHVVEQGTSSAPPERGAPAH